MYLRGALRKGQNYMNELHSGIALGQRISKLYNELYENKPVYNCI